MVLMEAAVKRANQRGWMILMELRQRQPVLRPSQRRKFEMEPEEKGAGNAWMQRIKGDLVSTAV